MRQDQISNSGETFDVPEGLCRQFSIDEILAATNDFSDSLVIGQGGFAKVYKGEIDNGTHTVAIKKSKSMSPELRKEFRDEILMVSKFRHSHLASLIGYCETDNEMILVYEYMAGGTLDDNLHRFSSRKGNNRVPLRWVERLKISIGVARALDYLHTGTGINNKVIHRDIKSSNILLDEDRSTAKISDFGMSKIGPANQPDTRVMTRVVGTFGYLDPDYYATGFLTSKSDVYAFGVVLFELLCGRPAVDSTLDEDQRSLAGWAQLCVKKGKVDRIIDLNLKSEIMPRSLSSYVKVAKRCLNACPKNRPTMTEVLAELVFALSLQENNEKKSDIAFHVGGSKIAEKLLLFLSVKPRLISGNSAGLDIAIETEATPNDNETAPNYMQAINSEPVAIPCVLLDELNKITNKFSKKAFIGGGPCGNAYYGILKTGQASCIKIFELNEFPEQTFLTKVSLLSKLKHENVVQLLRYCVDGYKPILAYEYAPNGSLHDILHGRKGTKVTHLSPVLSWPERVRIAIGAAKGLEYLHQKAQPNIIHRSIKSRNILLFNDCVAKIADIKISDDAPLEWRSSPPSITCDTIVEDYDAPEYTHFKVYNSKTDVFSFGVVLLELLTGRKVVDYALPLSERNLVQWATPKLRKEGLVKQCIDPRLKGQYPPKQAAKMATIVSWCLDFCAEMRPSMSIIVEHLQNL